MNPYERSAAPWSRWFIVSVCTLAVMAASAPLIAVSAFRVLSVEATTPIDWVPERFGPRRAYAEFVDEFESGDVVIDRTFLAGGGAKLRGLAAAISDALGFRVAVDLEK